MPHASLGAARRSIDMTAASPSRSTLEKTTLVVSAAARQDATYDVDLGEGQTKEVLVDVGAPVVVATPPPEKTQEKAAPQSGRPPLKTAGYIVGGVGVVSVGVGVVTGILAMTKASVVRDHCDTTTYACDSQGVDAAHAGNTFSPISTVTLIAGGALVLGGGAMIYLGGKKKEASVAIMPGVSPTGGTATLVGRF